MNISIHDVENITTEIHEIESNGKIIQVRHIYIKNKENNRVDITLFSDELKKLEITKK